MTLNDVPTNGLNLHEKQLARLLRCANEHHANCVKHYIETMRVPVSDKFRAFLNKLSVKNYDKK